jgi:hypothetical protein
MERYFHAEILEQKRQKELQERNLNAKDDYKKSQVVLKHNGQVILFTI